MVKKGKNTQKQKKSGKTQNLEWVISETKKKKKKKEITYLEIFELKISLPATIWFITFKYRTIIWQINIKNQKHDFQQQTKIEHKKRNAPKRSFSDFSIKGRSLASLSNLVRLKGWSLGMNDWFLEEEEEQISLVEEVGLWWRRNREGRSSVVVVEFMVSFCKFQRHKEWFG